MTDKDIPPDLSEIYKETITRNLKEIAEYSPYEANDRSVFFGGPGNYNRATEYAQEQDALLLNDQRAGELVVGLSEKNPETNRTTVSAIRDNMADPSLTPNNYRSGDVFDHHSTRYAEAAQGDVRTFVCGADQRATFRRVELDALLKNEKVDTINNFDREKLAEFYEATLVRNLAYEKSADEAQRVAADATFRKVGINEVRQDLNAARGAGDETAISDAENRLRALANQHRAELKAAIELKSEQEQGAQALAEQLELVAQQKADAEKVEADKLANQKAESDKAVAMKVEAANAAEAERADAYRNEEFEKDARAKAEIPLDERYQRIHDRAYARAEETAQQNFSYVTPDQLNEIASTKVAQVQQKMELNQERNELKAGTVPVILEDVTNYYNREIDFRETRAATYAEQNTTLGQPGIAMERQFESNRDLEVERRSEQFAAYARLEQNTRAGTISQDECGEHREQIDHVFSNLQRQDAQELGIHWGSQAVQGNTQKGSAKEQTSSLVMSESGSTSAEDAQDFTASSSHHSGSDNIDLSGASFEGEGSSTSTRNNNGMSMHR